MGKFIIHSLYIGGVKILKKINLENVSFSLSNGVTIRLLRFTLTMLHLKVFSHLSQCELINNLLLLRRVRSLLIIN